LNNSFLNLTFLTFLLMAMTLALALFFSFWISKLV
jgi:hypothetical protein